MAAYEQLISVSGSATAGQVPQANGSGGYTWATPAAGVNPSSATPAMDGTGAAGSSTDYARGDHVHPTDTSRAASSHSHGNITNAGAITATGVALANNDTLVFVDSSDSSKLKQTSIKFDGSTATKALTQKGTFETFLTSHQDISGLAPLASPALTGTPTAPTASAGTNTTQIATTAFVKAAVDAKSVPSASSTTPKMDGTATVGTETAFARGDHIHPTDTSRAASSHAHGNITNAGAITATGVALANNDTLVFVDSSDSSKLKQTSIKFDGSTATKALTQKGTFETFLTSHQDISGLAPLASPALTGTPTAPTAASGTNTTQIATTAFVKAAVDAKSVPSASSTTPKANGTAAVGTETAYSRGDHVHPTDTTRAALASPTFTGTPKAPTATAGTNTTQIATTAFVKTALDNATSSMVTISIPTSAWSDRTATVTCTGVTSTSNIIVTSDPSTMEAATAAGVYCSGQGTNSLTFSAMSDVPTTTLTMDVWIGNYIVSSVTYAPLSSPAFTGTPTAPTATAGTNTTQIATTAFVTSALSAYALKASPTFTGVPKAPTATAGDSSTQIATTAFVANALSNLPSGGSVMFKVDCGTVQTLPAIIYAANVTSTMELISSQLSNPAAQDGDWTVTTGNGSVTISGDIVGSTNVILYLSEVES